MQTVIILRGSSRSLQYKHGILRGTAYNQKPLDGQLDTQERVMHNQHTNPDWVSVELPRYETSTLLYLDAYDIRVGLRSRYMEV